jgi:pyruvate dehydrogenase E1 component alpha subunit
MAKSPSTRSGKSGSNSKASPEYKATRKEMLDFYRQMAFIRRFEEKSGQMYGQGLIGGFCHLYIGQEAVVVGFQSALQKGDGVITGYRSHGHAIVTGASAKEVMAELTGRDAGIARGKGGSMHMFDPEAGFYGGHGIVGAQVPLGAGLAFADKYKGTDNVTLTYFGDGAANQGQVYEAFNMAKLWNLPVIFIIENNQYAMGTSVSRSTGQPDLYRRGESLGIPGKQVDGMNVLAVRAAADEAVAHARAGKGPVLLELKTYRYRGHSMSDPAKYRSREEVQTTREERDPIAFIRKRLLEDGEDEDTLKSIDKEIKAEVADVADFAKNAPEPDPSELYTDILVES